MKIVRWIGDNILLLITLFLLAFIPLYPKLPLLDVTHAWVYIRFEDVLVALAVIVWFVQYVRKKATFKTPLTGPIFIFWSVGLVSTVYAIIFIFPYLHDAFSHVAILHYLRRIEYLSVFFIAYSAIKNKTVVPLITAVLAVTLLLVVAYGALQRLYGFPAFLTMNEEFAKGIPLRLSPLARIPSTFAGHYDLAAYLVMMIVLMGSMVFGFRNWFARLFFIGVAVAGLILLLMTASRVSFAVYLATITFLLIIQKKKLFIVPVVILSIVLLQQFQGISTRYSSTISEVDLVVDARTGKAVGVAKTLSKGFDIENKKEVVIEETIFTGEDLPQGSGYINIPSEQTGKGVTEVQYKRLNIKGSTLSAEITNMEGNFVIKKVLAYDVSFTTRFQGEWPRALEAFRRNILLGSGYSSISLATDNNYLRILGEIGSIGLFSFLLIFIVAGIYIKKIIPHVENNSAKSFILGMVAAAFGLGLNAALIDVFEASKVAFSFWLLIGAAVGVLVKYQKMSIPIVSEVKRILTSAPLIMIYFLILGYSFFADSLTNYFVGDDFMWLRGTADCHKEKCGPVIITIQKFFTDSGEFFYRPGAKLYFYAMYSFFWLSPLAYHAVQIFIHLIATAGMFLLSNRILKSKFFAFVTTLFFLVTSGHNESVFWISATGQVIAAALIIWSLLFYIYWKDTKRWYFLALSFFSTVVSFLFHELGIVAPLLIIVYAIIMRKEKNLKEVVTKREYLFFFLLIPLYSFIRTISNSYEFLGDYMNDFSKLPLNAIGNSIGYFLLSIFGTSILPIYTGIQTWSGENILQTVFMLLAAALLIDIIFVCSKKLFSSHDRNVVVISLCIFIIGILPFLGLGTISSQYVYLGSIGSLLLVVFVIQKIYQGIREIHFSLAIVVLLVIVSIFSFYHLKELERLNRDWRKAGQISNRLLIDFNDSYQKTNSTPTNPVFYFVNVPKHAGEAWIFPVGLSDALWFTFQNANLTVHTSQTLDMALDAAEGSASARVYQFKPDGTVEEIVRTKTIKPLPIKK